MLNIKRFRYTWRPRSNLSQKITNYALHIKFYYEKIRVEFTRFIFNIGRDEAAQIGRSNNVGTFDIKIEVRTQRAGYRTPRRDQSSV